MMTFSKLPLVATAVFHTTRYGETEARQRFEDEWRADKTVHVRRFNRAVRAGGASDLVVMIVVRRKEQQP